MCGMTFRGAALCVALVALAPRPSAAAEPPTPGWRRPASLASGVGLALLWLVGAPLSVWSWAEWAPRTPIGQDPTTSYWTVPGYPFALVPIAAPLLYGALELPSARGGALLAIGAGQLACLVGLLAFRSTPLRVSLGTPGTLSGLTVSLALP